MPFQTRADAINGADIVPGTISGDRLIDGSVPAAKIAPNSIGAAQITDHSIGTNQLVAHSIGSNEIVAHSIGSGEIAGHSIGANEIAFGGVGGDQIADGAIGGAKIANGAVGGNAIADGSIGGAKIANGAVGGNAIADGSVGGAKIPDGAIGGNHVNAAAQLAISSVIKAGAAWQTPTLGSGWATGPVSGTYQGIKYRKDAQDNVVIVGTVHTTSTTPAATLFTLAAGYVPATGHRVAVVSNAAGAASARWLDIDTSGNVAVSPAITAANTDVYLYATVPLGNLS